jgi:hypothetical protein
MSSSVLPDSRAAKAMKSDSWDAAGDPFRACTDRLV